MNVIVKTTQPEHKIFGADVDLRKIDQDASVANFVAEVQKRSKQLMWYVDLESIDLTFNAPVMDVKIELSEQEKQDISLARITDSIPEIVLAVLGETLTSDTWIVYKNKKGQGK